MPKDLEILTESTRENKNQSESEEVRSARIAAIQKVVTKKNHAVNSNAKASAQKSSSSNRTNASNKQIKIRTPKKGDCEHGRNKYHCKECGGSSICQHGRIKTTCKECGGSGICQHGRQKSKCKECGGAGI